MRIFRYSFAYRITLVVLLATGLALGTLMASSLLFDYLGARSQLRNRLSTMADIVGQNSAAALTFDDRHAASEVLQALQAEPRIVSACLYDLSGQLFAQYQAKDRSCPAGRTRIPNGDTAHYSVTRLVQRRGEAVGTLFLSSDLQDLQKRLRLNLHVSGALLIVALFVGGSAGLVLQRRITKPVSDLVQAMHHVTVDQNFTARVEIAGSDEIARLGTGFNTMLSELQQRDLAKKKAEARLEYQALNDELTGLPNRRLLSDRLSQALALARRKHYAVALLFIDLDGFKLVNDSLGHTIGDILLGQVAERFRSRVRESDTLARLGGDEFTVVVGCLDAKEQAGLVAKNLLEVLQAPFLIEGHEITISASIGVSLFPENGADAGDLLQQADSAMYAAKRNGRNRMMYYTKELGTSARERMSLENQLRGAVARGEIQVHYQPEFDLSSRRLVRFEALARWVHPTLGTISPAKFIPIAEETGLIVPLGAYIMERACAQAVTWQTITGYPIQVAVNVSSIQFVRDTFVDEVAEMLRHTGLEPSLLQIELTESVMLSGAERAAETMKRLRALGVSLAIDDFGTGYSSLGYLPKLPFNALKIDRSFVKDLEERSEIRALVHSLVALAHSLGMQVIVEGIETQNQLDLIAQLGGDEIQGYLFGKPTADPSHHLYSGQHAMATDGHQPAQFPMQSTEADSPFPTEQPLAVGVADRDIS